MSLLESAALFAIERGIPGLQRKNPSLALQTFIQEHPYDTDDVREVQYAALFEGTAKRADAWLIVPPEQPLPFPFQYEESCLVPTFVWIEVEDTSLLETPKLTWLADVWNFFDQYVRGEFMVVAFDRYGCNPREVPLWALHLALGEVTR